MPEADELVLLFTEPLDRAGIRYLVTGSVASIFMPGPLPGASAWSGARAKASGWRPRST